MEEELRRARVKCPDAAMVSQLQTAAATYGVPARKIAQDLGAHVMNE